MAEAAGGWLKQEGRRRAWESRDLTPPWTSGPWPQRGGPGQELEPRLGRGRRKGTASEKQPEEPTPRSPKKEGGGPRAQERRELEEGREPMVPRPATPGSGGEPVPNRRPDPSTPRDGRWSHPANGCNPKTSQRAPESGIQRRLPSAVDPGTGRVMLSAEGRRPDRP